MSFSAAWAELKLLCELRSHTNASQSYVFICRNYKAYFTAKEYGVVVIRGWKTWKSMKEGELVLVFHIKAEQLLVLTWHSMIYLK